MMKMKLAKTAAALLATVLLGAAYSFAASNPRESVVAINASAANTVYGATSEYKSGRFYKNLKALTLTGDQACDTLAVALSQLGYHEGDSERDFGGESLDGSRDFVEYNVLYGKLDNGQGNGMSYGYYWCASFVNWCLRQAGVGEEASAGAEVSCERWIAACRESGIYNSKSGYIPQSGDMIFFRDLNSSRSATHIGLVLYSDGSEVYTIEGNTSDGSGYSEDGEYVALKSYELSSAYIVGYASPEYDGTDRGKGIDYSGDFLTKGEYIISSDTKLYSTDKLNRESKEELEAFSLVVVTEVGQEYLRIRQGAQSRYIKRDGSAVQATTYEKVYTVEYLNENGVPMYMPQYRVSGQEKSTYTNTPKRDKSGFVGWRMPQEPDKTFYPGDKLPILDGDIKLSPVWDDNFYVVYFKDPDGIIIKECYGYYGDPVEPPAPPEAPQGYVFYGWGAEVDKSIKGNASYTAVFISEDELAAVGGETESSAGVSADFGCAAVSGGVISVTAASVALFGIVFKRKKPR